MSAAADLRTAADRLEQVRERVESRENDVSRVADAYRSVARVMEQYEERATDWDDFEGYVRFREAFARALTDIPDDLPHTDAIEAADDHLTSPASRPLSESDFRDARTALEPLAAYRDLDEEFQEAREAYRGARRTATTERRECEARVEELERLVRLGAADLDAPVEELRDPIERYNEAVCEAFRSFRSSASAREVFGFVERTRAYPLAAFDPPPERLAAFVRSSPAGEEPIPTLLEYADYSRSKLDHYVDDPQGLKGAVATNRTYLDGLDASPLTVDWPPPPADELVYRVRELVSVVARLSDDPIPVLREVRALTDSPAYERLREAAVARVELDAEERERLTSGAVEDDLAATRDRLADLEAALEDCPPLD